MSAIAIITIVCGWVGAVAGALFLARAADHADRAHNLFRVAHLLTSHSRSERRVSGLKG
jgi:hypothetical protein